MKSAVGLTWSQTRVIKRFLKSVGIEYYSEAVERQRRGALLSSDTHVVFHVDNLFITKKIAEKQVIDR